MRKNQHRTRAVTVLSAAFLSVLLLCGCGDGNDRPANDTDTAGAVSAGEHTDTAVTAPGTDTAGPNGETDSRPDTGTEAPSAPETAPESRTETAAPESPTDAPVPTETEPPPVTEPQTEAETQPHGVPYTGEAHPGTDIYYVGTGENASRIIVIDAGHQKVGDNGKEPVGPGSDIMKGKVSYGTTSSFTGGFEYELTLRVSLALRDVLIARGYTVVMIRETDEVNISNIERAQIANAYRADCFIRIHANGWSDESVSGGMTMCQTAHNPFPTCAAHYRESRLLAESVSAAYRAAVGIGTYHGGLWESDDQTGINWSEVPTTILEMGFMTNRADDELMATDEFRLNAARGIADGIEAFLAASR